MVKRYYFMSQYNRFLNQKLETRLNIKTVKTRRYWLCKIVDIRVGVSLARSVRTNNNVAVATQMIGQKRRLALPGNERKRPGAGCVTRASICS